MTTIYRTIESKSILDVVVGGMFSKLLIEN